MKSHTGSSRRRLGDQLPKERGRLSLNPIKHVDPFGTVILPLLLADQPRAGVRLGQAGAGQLSPASQSAPRHGAGRACRAGDEPAAGADRRASCWRRPVALVRAQRPSDRPYRRQRAQLRADQSLPRRSSTCCRCRRSTAVMWFRDCCHRRGRAVPQDRPLFVAGARGAAARPPGDRQRSCRRPPRLAASSMHLATRSLGMFGIRA